MFQSLPLYSTSETNKSANKTYTKHSSKTDKVDIYCYLQHIFVDSVEEKKIAQCCMA